MYVCVYYQILYINFTQTNMKIKINMEPGTAENKFSLLFWSIQVKDGKSRPGHELVWNSSTKLAFCLNSQFQLIRHIACLKSQYKITEKRTFLKEKWERFLKSMSIPCACVHITEQIHFTLWRTKLCWQRRLNTLTMALACIS